MKSFTTVCSCIALVGLAGCWENAAESPEVANGDDVVEQTDASLAPEPLTDIGTQGAANPTGPAILMPGSWDTRGKVLEYKLSGVDPAVAAQKEKFFTGRQLGLSQTLTETMAVRPSGNFLAATAVMSCTDDIEMSGGKIDGTMSCPAEGGGFSKSKVTGTYTPDKYAVTVEMTGPVVFKGSSPGATEYRKYTIEGQNLDALAKSQGY